MKLTLQAKGPFNFRAVIGSHGWFQLAPFVYDEPGGLLTYVLRLGPDRVVELRIRAADGGVLVQTAESLSAAERKLVSSEVAWMFGLDLDLAPFYAAVRHEPKLA